MIISGHPLNQCRVLQLLNIVLAGLHAKLKGKHGDGYEKKSCAVCSGLDMVQIHLLNIIFKDEGTAEVSKTLVKKPSESKDGHAFLTSVCYLIAEMVRRGEKIDS